MTGWTLLLEALHSAFVSALKQQGANPVLELGMPQRLPGFKFPEPLRLPAQFLITEVDIPASSPGSTAGKSASGFTGLLFQSDTPPILEIWNALHRHTGVEFAQKKIRPILSKPTVLNWEERMLRPDEIFKRRIQMPTRTLWIPVRWGKDRAELALFLAM
ncbi:MAG: hypothetical protein RJB38_577 [Pseudomonadota bacterium]|jgi:hypothetical protein